MASLFFDVLLLLFLSKLAVCTKPGDTSCPPGQVYHEITKCTPCAAGTFFDRFFCAACPANQFQPDEGKTQCIPCPPGTASTAGSSCCTTCPEGQAPLTGNKCGVCPPGHRFVPERSQCAKCYTRNTFNPSFDLSTSCFPCPEGSQSHIGAASCTFCPPGQVLIVDDPSFSGEGPQICATCRAGTFYERESLKCFPCPASSFSAGGVQTECETCANGTFALEGASECTACPEGQALLRSGCGRCQPGHGIVQSFGSCQSCPANYFSNGSQPCRPCAAGTFAGFAAASCIACPEGTVYDMYQGRCTVCAAGQRYNVHRAACEQCEFGVALEPNIRKDRICQLCPDGLMPSRNATVCVPRVEGPLSLGAHNGVAHA